MRVYDGGASAWGVFREIAEIGFNAVQRAEPLGGLARLCDSADAATPCATAGPRPLLLRS